MMGVDRVSILGRAGMVRVSFQCRVEVRTECCQYKAVNLREQWDDMLQPFCETAGNDPKPEISGRHL